MRDGRYQLAVLVFIVSRPNNCKNAILLSFFVCLLLILEILTTMKSLHWYYCEGQTIILCCFVNELVLSFINKVSSCVHAFVIYVSCLVNHLTCVYSEALTYPHTLKCECFFMSKGVSMDYIRTFRLFHGLWVAFKSATHEKTYFF